LLFNTITSAERTTGALTGLQAREEEMVDTEEPV
jgi:hypothetical protein